MKRQYAVLLACILVSALLIRLLDIGTMPVAYDENNYYYIAALTLKSADPLFVKTVYYNSTYEFTQPWLSSYINMPVMLIFPSLVSFRAVSALFGTAAIFMVFLIARKLFDIRVALLSAFLYAFSVPVIAYSRIGLPDAILSFFMLAAIYLYFTNREKKGYFFTGISASAKFSGFLLAPLFMLYEYLKSRTIRVGNILYVAAGYLLIMFPSFLVWDVVSKSRGMLYHVPVGIKLFVNDLWTFPVTTAMNISLPNFLFSHLLFFPFLIGEQIGIPVMLLFVTYFAYSNRKVLKKDMFLILWILCGFAITFMFNIVTMRYALTFIAPIIMLSSSAAFGIKDRRLSMAVVGALMICTLIMIAIVHPNYILYGSDAVMQQQYTLPLQVMIK